MRPLLVIAALAVVPTVSFSQTNLLVNGSFETGPPVPELYDTLGGGDTSITGWTVLALAPGGTIDYVSTNWPASDGSYSLDLNGTPGPGGIEQTFATYPGQDYQVLFDIASNPAGPAMTTLEVLAAGQSQQFSAYNSDSFTDMGWTTDSWSFQANSTQTTIEFLQVSPFGGNEGTALDNVRVAWVYVPIPGDVNGDMVVNGLDISLVSAYWLRTGQGLAGDANHDGVVNGLDIAPISANWLNTFPASGNGVPVPEPSTLVLLGSAALMLGVLRLRGAMSKCSSRPARTPADQLMPSGPAGSPGPEPQ